MRTNGTHNCIIFLNNTIYKFDIERYMATKDTTSNFLKIGWFELKLTSFK